MLNHILVATDFSARSDRALRRAILLARHASAALVIAHVVDDDQPAQRVRAQTDSAATLLDGVVRTVRDHDRVAAAPAVVSGAAAPAILAAADRVGADLIVLGAHRRQFRDVFVGTTAERTIARSPIPVLMAAGVPSAPYAEALVALGGERGAQAIAQSLRSLGMLGAGATTAVRAYDLPALGVMRRGMIAQGTIDEYMAAEALDAAAALDRMVTTVDLPAERRLVRPIDGSVARTILACAREDETPLIVVGTSQRSGLERFLLGSVAEDVLGHADRDVLVVPHRHPIANEPPKAASVGDGSAFALQA